MSQELTNKGPPDIQSQDLPANLNLYSVSSLSSSLLSTNLMQMGLILWSYVHYVHKSVL